MGTGRTGLLALTLLLVAPLVTAGCVRHGVYVPDDDDDDDSSDDDDDSSAADDDDSAPQDDDDTDVADDDDTAPVDADGDGVTADQDCDDEDPSVFPGAEETCDGRDEDCDGLADVGACDALAFDGDDLVTVPSHTAMDMDDFLTIELWLMFTEDPHEWTGDRRYVLDRYGNYRLWFEPDGGPDVPADQFFFDLWDWDGVWTDQDHWETGVWYHLAMSWDGAVADVYVNGVLQASEPVAKELWAVANPILIGAGADGVGFVGLLDEVRLWSSARFEAQIRASLCSVVGDEPGLAAAWSFDEGSGQSVLDSSPSAMHGVRGTDLMGEDSDPERVEDDPDCFGLEWCDGEDNDGDGLVDEADSLADQAPWYIDADGDGFGDPASASVEACEGPADHVDNDDDCDDADADVFPGAVEAANGIDDDCDGFLDEPVDGSLHFDGTDDGVWVNASWAMTVTDAITMEAWVYAEQPGDDEPILAKEHDWGNQQYWFGIFGGSFGLLLGDGAGWGLWARSSGSVPADSWIHLASVWDGSSWFNYADGVLVDQGSWVGTPPPTGHPLTFGVNSTFDNTRFAGYLADVRLWSVARTATQIEQEMWGVADTTGLIGRWTLDEGSGQVAFDGSGNDLHGRLGVDDWPDERDPSWSEAVPEP